MTGGHLIRESRQRFDATASVFALEERSRHRCAWTSHRGRSRGGLGASSTRRERSRGQHRLYDHICVSEISLIDGDNLMGVIGVLRILGGESTPIGRSLRFRANERWLHRVASFSRVTKPRDDEFWGDSGLFFPFFFFVFIFLLSRRFKVWFLEIQVGSYRRFGKRTSISVVRIEGRSRFFLLKE